MAALPPSAAGALLALLVSTAVFSASAVSLARVVTSFWTAAEELLPRETAAVASVSISESVASVRVVVIAWAGVGRRPPAAAPARDCEMKAREEATAASESLSVVFFGLPPGGAITVSALALAPASAAAAADAATDDVATSDAAPAAADDAAAAALWAASACDCASASVKVSRGVLPCGLASPAELAPLAAAVPAASTAALAVSDRDWALPGFERVLENDLVLEEAAHEPETLPEAFAVESLESPQECVEPLDSLEPLAPEAACLPPMVLVRVRWLVLSECDAKPEFRAEVEADPELEPVPKWATERVPAPELTPWAKLAASAAPKPAVAVELSVETALAAFVGAVTAIERSGSSATDQFSLRPDALGAFVGFPLLEALERVPFLALPALHGRAYGFRALGRVLPVLALGVALGANAGDHLILLVERFVESGEEGLEIARRCAVDARFGAG